MNGGPDLANKIEADISNIYIYISMYMYYFSVMLIIFLSLQPTMMKL